MKLLVALALAAGVVAVAASNEAPQGDITGSAGPVSVTLDADNPSVEKTVSASLSASLPVESGQVQLNANFGDGVAQVRMNIDSLSDSAEVDVEDTSAQPQVGLGVDAFGDSRDCKDTPCEDTITVSFERLEADVTDAITFDFTVDGAASVTDDGSGAQVDGSLDLTVN